MFDRLMQRETAARKTLMRSLPKNGVGVELGVWKGDFSARLLSGATPRHLHLIDPWQVSAESDRTDEAWYGADRIDQHGMDEICRGVERRFSSQIAAGRVVIHRRPSADAMQSMATESVDWVYIDGDHSYEAVVADLEEAFRVTREGGMICCDDYFLGSWWKDGVVRAVHEFLASKPVVIHSKVNSQVAMRKRRP